MGSFKALQTRESADGKFETSVVDREIESLPAGEVLIRVHYSSLNYKDALSASGNRGDGQQKHAVTGRADQKSTEATVALLGKLFLQYVEHYCACKKGGQSRDGAVG